MKLIGYKIDFYFKLIKEFTGWWQMLSLPRKNSAPTSMTLFKEQEQKCYHTTSSIDIYFPIFNKKYFIKSKSRYLCFNTVHLKASYYLEAGRTSDDLAANWYDIFLLASYSEAKAHTLKYMKHEKGRDDECFLSPPCFLLCQIDGRFFRICHEFIEWPPDGHN